MQTALVGEAHVEAVTVGRRVDRDRFDAHFAAGPDDAQGDFTAVSDENFLEFFSHGCWFSLE